MLDNGFSACIVPYILFPLCIYLLFIPYFDFYDLILFVSISFKLAIFSLSLFIFFISSTMYNRRFSYYTYEVKVSILSNTFHSISCSIYICM